MRIFRIVSIDVQSGNVGGGGGSATLSEQGHRRGALENRTTPLSAAPSTEPEDLSSDYFRKVPPKRRGWATSLGLCEANGRPTEDGERFLETVRASGYSIPGGEAFALWPLDFELQQMRLQQMRLQLGVTIQSPWKFLLMVSQGLGAAGVREADEETVSSGVEFLKTIYNHYRSLNPRRSMLRRELPIQVAFSVAVAVSYAQEDTTVPIPDVIKAEAKQPKAQVQFRPTGSVGGALVVRV